MTKLRFHPLFFALAVMLILLGKARIFALGLISVLAHEWGHSAVAAARGYNVAETVLLPYGAQLTLTERPDKRSMFYIAIAGPLVSLSIALCALFVGALLPQLSSWTEPLRSVNFGLFFFNLMPAYPLDGARVILALSKNRLRALFALRAIGVALSFLSLALFVFSIFWGFSLTLGITAVFLFIGATDGTERELYALTADAL